MRLIMTDAEKMIKRHLVLNDANFICQFLDIPPSVAEEACASYQRIQQHFKVLFDERPNEIERNCREFERAEISIINTLNAEAQKHD